MLQEAIVTTPPTILPNFKSLCQPPRLVRSAFPSGYELPRYPPVTCWGERFIFFQSVFFETPYCIPFTLQDSKHWACTNTCDVFKVQTYCVFLCSPLTSDSCLYLSFPLLYFNLNLKCGDLIALNPWKIRFGCWI